MDPEADQTSTKNRIAIIGGIAGFMAGMSALIASILKVKTVYIAWIVGLIVLTFLIGFTLYKIFGTLRKSRLRDRFRSVLGGVFDAAGRGKDPEAVARLAILQRKFDAGIKKYKDSGKDIYDLPWFVIIGPSGSGKTCALREGRLPGMDLISAGDAADGESGGSAQTKGKGGTLLMDWWFGDQAVILDTAGSLVFPEERALESPEWRELLKLLKRQRPECPINGLFVAVDAQKLLLDDPSLEEYADQLRAQIEQLQKSLDLRFPLYFLITKSDVIPGFREYAHELVQSCPRPVDQQLVGWTNPKRVTDPPDEPFRASDVEEIFSQVADRLRRRRLRLVRDLAGQSAQFSGEALRDFQNRAGSLFALPDEVERTLGPRLQKWMEKVFRSRTWSVRPVFVRGIYFTSAMQEGGVLDSAKAGVLGIPLKVLLERQKGIRTQRKSFFLRDVFTEKAFKEQGLVIPLTDARKYVSNKKRLVVGTAIGATLLYAAMVGWGYVQLKRTVQGELERWTVVRDAGGPGARQLKKIIERTPLGEMTYQGDVKLATGQRLVEVHRDLAERTRANLRLGALGTLYRPLGILRVAGPDFEKLRRRAQTNLFEQGVVEPLMELTRQQMLREADWLTTANLDPAALSERLSRHNQAFLALVRLETEPPREARWDAARAEEFGRGWLGAHLGYLLAKDPADAVREWAPAFRDTYVKEMALWPPAHLRLGDRLSTNLFLRSGITNFNLLADKVQGRLRERLRELTNACRTALDYQQSELKETGSFVGQDTTYRMVKGQLVDLTNKAAELAEAIGKVAQWEPEREGGILRRAFVNLQATNAVMLSNLRTDFGSRLVSPGQPTNALHTEIMSAIQSYQDSLSGEIQSHLAFWERPPGLGRLDSNITVRVSGPEGGAGEPLFRYRLLVLKRVTELTNNVQGYPQIASTDWEPVREQWRNGWERLRNDFPDYAARFGPEWSPRLSGLTNLVWGQYLYHVARVCRQGVKEEMSNKIPVEQSLGNPSDLISAVGQLGDYERKWKVFGDVLNRDARTASEARDEVKAAISDIENRRSEIFANVVARLEDQLAKWSRFPVGAGNPPQTPAEVESSFRAFESWQSNLANSSSDLAKAVKSLGKERYEELTSRLASLGEAFAVVVDPQFKQVRQARITFVHPSQLDPQSEGVDAGYFRRVTISAGRERLHPSTLEPRSSEVVRRQTKRFSLDSTLEVQVRYGLKSDPNADAAAEVSLPPPDDWSVIRWIREYGDRRPRRDLKWEIPVAVTDREVPPRTGRLRLEIELDPKTN